MATTAGYFDRKPLSTIRPGLSHLQREPGSPHTPQRTYSSTFSSPSASFIREEEPLVFELGARHLSVGFAADSAPRCILGFGPEESRRVGDYRRWLPGYEDSHKKKQPYSWGEDYELWRMNLGDVDLGLVEDKIERAAREAHSKYLLLDSKSRRLFLILPSVIPHQLLSSVLSTFFLNFQTPSITLLSTPILSTVAAGCRSGLIVDVGWSETIVTAVYEFREVYERRTTRAMRLLTLKMAELLHWHAERDGKKSLKSDDPTFPIESMLGSYFEQSEEVTTRMAWCRNNEESCRPSGHSEDLPQELDRLVIAEDNSENNEPGNESQDGPMISVPSPLHPRQNLQIPLSSFAEPTEEALLAKAKTPHELDDHETPLHLLIYRSLLTLPADVRAICMSRIIITGGGSNIPGLKFRLLEEVASLVSERGWDPVHGKAADERRRRLKEISSNRRGASSELDHAPNSTVDGLSKSSKSNIAALEPQEPDPIEDKIKYEEAKGAKSSVSGIVRGVETLGAWAGGSLVAGLKIKGIVEVERESFLQYGLAGARKDAELSTMAQRQSFGPGATKAGIGEKSGWTLGAWA